MPYTMKQVDTLEMKLLAEKTAMQILDRIRGYGEPHDVIGIAYLFYKLLNSNDNGLDLSLNSEDIAKQQLERFRTGEIMLNPYILNTLLPRVSKSFIRAYKIYEDIGDHDDVYAAVVLLSGNYLCNITGKMAGMHATSDSVVGLTQAILEISDGESVADICCGEGNFITKSIELRPEAHYYGYEININCLATLAMKADVMGVNPMIVMGDVAYTLANNDVKFDKIFSNYPFGLKSCNMSSQQLPFSIRRNSSDWYFNNLVIEHLAENGKGVVVASTGSTWNLASREARKYFIDNGYIEAVINLPGGLMYGTDIPVTMYVFSHNNQSIKLVNAEDIVTIKNKFTKFLSENDIREVLSLLQEESERSVLITREDAQNNDYSLSFRTYSSSLPKYENGILMSEVADIIRGTLNPRKSITTENTGKYLLQISDLENGSIKDDLGDDKFVNIDDLNPEQKLLPYDLVISRIGQLPIKAAIVSPEEKRELYPNGNMYVIRVKESSVNPYYLLAFLLSRDGQEALSCAATGSVIKIISVSALSKMVFPLKSADEQKKIAEVISESMAQYEIYTYKADLAKDKIENAYYHCEED